MAYTSEHYGDGDGVALLSMAKLAAVRFFRNYYRAEDNACNQYRGLDLGCWDPEQQPAALWLAQGCLDSEVTVDEDGNVHELDPGAADYEEALERLANEDVSAPLTVDRLPS